MADQNPQETSSFDDETLESLQQALYPRLRDHLVSEVGDRLLREAVELPIPPYYDRFMASELQRLEEAIERNAQRIDELREEMDRRFAEAKKDRDRRFAEAKEERAQLRAEMEQRFVRAKEDRDRRFAEAQTGRDQLRDEIAHLRTEMNDRFENMERRFDQLTVSIRNWALAAVAFITVIVTILSFVLR